MAVGALATWQTAAEVRLRW